jgi:hypothetical protein
MRSAKAQCRYTMSRLGALQQPPKPHVSHAEIGGYVTHSESGAILRTDSKEHKSKIPSVLVRKFS